MIPKSFITSLHESGLMMTEILNISLKNLISGMIDLNFFHNNLATQRMYLDRYRTKTALGQWKRIEDLTQEEKIYYWEEAGKITREREDRIKMSLVIYTIDKLITLDENYTPETTKES